MSIHLMSHILCPYVQRAVIALSEKNVEFKRTYIDLDNSPEWFLQISPLGKTPVLVDDGVPIFESSAILEYLEETQLNSLHPSNPLERARHRGWIEFSSAVLNDIGDFYSAKDAASFVSKVNALKDKFSRLELEIGDGEYFTGKNFSLVDVVFGPVFRYFDVFDQIDDFGIMTHTPKVNRWRNTLAKRPSIISAVSPDYNALLYGFLCERQSHLGSQLSISSGR